MEEIINLITNNGIRYRLCSIFDILSINHNEVHAQNSKYYKWTTYYYRE